MSFNDADQSGFGFRSFQNAGLPQTTDFGDDGPIRLSLHRGDKLKEMLSLLPLDIRPTFDQSILIFLKEVNLAQKNQATTSSQHGACKFESRTVELRFSNNIATPLLTGDHIKGVGGVPITLSLVDSRTKEEVKSGPEASGTVKIVALDGVTGEAARNEIKSLIVRSMDGNKPICVTNLSLNLIQGKALLPDVSFPHNKNWTKISKIWLEARFVDDFNGVQVKEAHTNTFVLKDRRTAAYMNHEFPSLHDNVWRLEKIGRRGPLAVSLREAGIKTVEDFLVRLFQHPRCLEEIFDRENCAKSLKVTVAHARKCPAKLKYYSRFDQKTEVVFNVSGEVLGMYLHGQFLSTDMLSESQKEIAKSLVKSAFQNWGSVVTVGEDQFVGQCFPPLLSSLSSCNPGGHTLATTFENNVFLDGLDFLFNESSLFGNVLSDGQPQFLSEPFRRRYDEIYCEFKSVCISSRVEPEPVFGSAASQKSRFCKKWRMLYWVVAFTIGSLSTRSIDGICAHKKPRLYS